MLYGFQTWNSLQFPRKSRNDNTYGQDRGGIEKVGKGETTVGIWRVDAVADVEANAIRGYDGAESPSVIPALRCNTMAAFFLPFPA